VGPATAGWTFCLLGAPQIDGDPKCHSDRPEVLKKSTVPKGNGVDRAPSTYYIKPVFRLSCIAALSLAAINSGFVQTLAAAQAAPADPAAPPAAAPPAAAPPAAATSTAAQDKMVTLQYPNSDVADVLHLYSQLTNKKLVMDNFVQGKVNIFLNRPVPRDEAIKIIEMNLLMNGYSLVPAENDIVKVIGTGKNPRGAGVPIISDDADIPTGDHIISFVFKLRYADPIELQQVLGQYLSPPQTFTSFLALPKSSSIIVTENSSTIRSLVRIIDQVDIPPAEVVSEFIKLERADATKVVEMLKEVFDKGGQPAVPGGVPAAQPNPGVKGVRPVIPGVVPAPTKEEADLGMMTALSEDSIVVGKIKIAADIRTNRIHVITRPINMPFIRKLIAEFDANVEFAKPITRPLRYISASDILPVLVQALTEPGTNQNGGGDAGSSNPAAQTQQPRTRAPSSNPGGFDSGFSGGGNSGGGQNFSEELSTQAVDTAPKAVTIGNAKIIADQRSNAIIVLGNREVVVKVMKILDEMDVKAPQVALSTVIGELQLDKNDEFGVDYFGRAKESVSGVITSRNASAQLPPSEIRQDGFPTGGGILDPANLLQFRQIANIAGGGTNVYLAAGNSLLAIVRMLHSTGNFKVVSRPTVFTTNNKKAIIASGQEIPVPVNTLSNGGNNLGLAQQSTIQYKKIALQLEVVPLINSEKEVTLEILQKLDSIAGSTRVDDNQIPTIATKYIKTTVSAPNCSTIVLGGLIQDRAERNTSGIPLLSRIPVVGALFRNTSKVKQRTELLILMRPEVALTKLDLYRLRQKASDKTHLGPEVDNDDCPDCPKPGDGKQLDLPPPDLPGMK
jgi:type II secretion system protein D